MAAKKNLGMISVEEVYDLMQSKLDNVLPQFAHLKLSRTMKRILLDYCRWNENDLRWELCSNERKSELFKRCNLENIISTNTNKKITHLNQPQFSCEICMEDIIEKVDLTCGHSSCCPSCLRNHIKAKMNDLLLEEPIRCPTMGCNCPIEDDIILTLLKDPALKRKYYRRIVHGFVKWNSRLHACSQSGCDRIISTLTSRRRQVQCICSKFTFCARCGAKWQTHHDCGQNVDETDEENQDPESQSVAEVKRISKPCPGCGARIQKNGGCDNMFCIKCRCYFKWTTLKLISPPQDAYLRQIFQRAPHFY